MTVKQISAARLKDLVKSEELEIIDVREKDEYRLVHIEGSKLIPMSEIPNRLDEIDWRKNVVFVCRTGARSKAVCQALNRAGKEVSNLQNGLKEYFSQTDDEDKQFDREVLDKYFS